MQEDMIKIYSKLDIITARMHARSMARTAGLDEASQICVALATWSLAHTLRLGELYPGRIAMTCLKDKARTGVRVSCTKENGVAHDLSADLFSDMRWMVDDLTIDRVSPNTVQVSIVKWAELEKAKVPSPLQRPA